MTHIPKKKPVVSAELIARRADQGDDVSSFFTSRGRMVGPPEQAEQERRDALMAKPARERMLRAVAVANRVIEKTLAQTGANTAETVKNRQ